MNFFIRPSLKLNKLDSNTVGLLTFLQRQFSSSTKVNNVKFDFEVSKFNDIHVKSTNVVRFSEQTNYDPNVFEANLESKPLILGNVAFFSILQVEKIIFLAIILNVYLYRYFLQIFIKKIF